MNQCELIMLYEQLRGMEMDDPSFMDIHRIRLKTERDHALFSLQRMIESFGPTADYEHWKNELGK